MTTVRFVFQDTMTATLRITMEFEPFMLTCYMVNVFAALVLRDSHSECSRSTLSTKRIFFLIQFEIEKQKSFSSEYLFTSNWASC